MKQSTWITLLSSAAFAFAASGCGSDEPPPPPPPPNTTSITITSPSNNATGVALGRDADITVPIEFTLQNFTLSNSCTTQGSSSTCGHLHINIDGTACNLPASPYNGTVESGTKAFAKFAVCGASVTKAGPHTIKLSLQDKNHQPIQANGANVEAQVQVTTVEEAGKPKITVTPLSAPVAKNTDVPLTIAVSDFTVRAFDPAPAACATASTCGHVRVLVDNAMTCQAPNPMGGSFAYNNVETAAAPTTATVKLTQCAALVGEHDVIVALYDDAGQPIKDKYGNTVAAKTKITINP